MKLTQFFKDFFHSEKTGGLLLVLCAMISLFLANSTIGSGYIPFWQTTLGEHTINEWINDGLMTIFFLLIGLELEREWYAGELSDRKNALLPLIAAIGGVVMPAFIYWIFTKGTADIDGMGIPMATDIAFAVGILSVLGDKVPPSLKVFLTALAVIDDLMAILVIAFFYTESVSLLYLSLTAAVAFLLFILNRLKIHNGLPYLLGGLLLWYFMLKTGVHPTLAGVILAFALPFGKGDRTSISFRWQHLLHRPVAFLILPLFALANTALIIPSGVSESIHSPLSHGIMIGLVVGKPLGICLFSVIAVGWGFCQWPLGINWKHIIGAGLLGGIGFTMSIFITLLAFEETSKTEVAKISIMIASLVAGLLGLIYLLWLLSDSKKKKVSV